MVTLKIMMHSSINGIFSSCVQENVSIDFFFKHGGVGRGYFSISTQMQTDGYMVPFSYNRQVALLFCLITGS